MRLTLQITSWFSLVLGLIALAEGFAASSTDVNSGYTIAGGLLFGIEGLLALIYVHQEKK